MPTNPIITQKQCTRCGGTKSLDSFNKHTRKADGKRDWCRDCEREARYEYNHTPHGREMKRLYQQRYKSTEYAKQYVKDYAATGKPKAASKRWIMKKVQDPIYIEKRNAKGRANYAIPENAEKARQQRYRKNFGITVEDFDRMMKEQNGLCAICQASPLKAPMRKRLNVDHDHQTGKVRGLLCNPCNSILGRWRDSPETADRAADYLRKHRQLKLVV